MNKFIGLSAILIFCAALYMSFSGTWLAADINAWQARLQGEPKFYPALTAFVLTLPPLLLLALLKWWWKRRTT